ncbi:competence protein CoiA family protein [Methanobrevibacter millerae]|uniref:Competence protein CoiA-like family protein n=1 Tax=Methanobrevibacter millerae TaxID=230361 RepID=A0A1G5WGI9_9EURY|nr:competence protein CoiA family protein [Methanobrevibacter millerae]SDA57261.1 Competence protein CoiA-like family protein [Methanobrevibacter millerae]
MLVALNDKNEYVSAFDVEKYDSKGNLLKYYCPECGEELILRKGNVYQHHFSHKNKDTICRLRENGGESDIHNFLKYKIKKIIEKDNDLIKSEIEYPIGSLIADYYCELKDKYNNKKKVAVEIVHKHTNIKDFVDKNEYYYSTGVYSIWVFNIDKFTSKTKTVTSNISMDEIIHDSSDFLETVRVTEIIRDAHVMHFGKVFALDPFNEKVYCIHVNSLYSNSSKYPHNIIHLLLEDFKIEFFKKSASDDFLNYNRSVAGPNIEKFWDKKPFDYIFKKNKESNNVNIHNNEQLLSKKEFYDTIAVNIGIFEDDKDGICYEIIYKENNLIFYDKINDDSFKYEVSTIEDTLLFLEDNLGLRDNIHIELIPKLVSNVRFNNKNGIFYSEDDGIFKPDSKSDFSEFDDFINFFNKNYIFEKNESFDDEYIDYEDYIDLKNKSNAKDLKIIPKDDKYCLVEYLEDKTYLHGMFDTWDEADAEGRLL